MSKWDSEETEFEFGFDPVLPGAYLFQVEEGIQTHQAESGAVSLQIPLSVVDSQDDALKACIGRRISIFQNIVKKDGDPNEYGERIIGQCITSLKAGKYFASKFEDDLATHDERIILEMNKVLPGRMVQGMVRLGKDMNGNDRAEVKSLKQHKQQKELDVKGTSSSAAETKAADEDWG